MRIREFVISELGDELHEYISDADLESYFGKRVLTKGIVKYGDLDDYATISKLLPKKKDYKIILLENKLNSGHWVVLIRDGNIIEYFNSYGLRPSKELDYNTDLINQQLDQETRHLDILLKKALEKGFRVVYNKRRFQKMKDDVATCGKHVILRTVMFREHGMTLQQYIAFMESLERRFDLEPDLLVTALVRKHR